jgi:transmembrane sensor
MNDNATYYTDLITRYFSGELDGDELRLLSDWLKNDPEHEVLFMHYQKTWQLLEKNKIHTSVNTDQEWIAMKAKMNDGFKVIPLTQKSSRLKLKLKNVWKVAAAVTVLLASTFLLYLYLSKPKDILVIARASNLEQILPDGSVVSLHAGSQITYPEIFSTDARNVELKGEAYFEVVHDKTKPFIVASGDARVKVMGTQFNVNTLTSEGSLEVVLTSGKVSVYFKEKPQDNVVLMPGEKAALIAEQKVILKTTNTDPNYMAWKTRVLVFSNETLAEVVKTLQHVYQTPIKITDTQLSDCRVTASFDDQSLQSVLEVVKETLGLKLDQNDGVIEISGKGCR